VTAKPFQAFLEGKTIWGKTIKAFRRMACLDFLAFNNTPF
jgi:hypothetical protein